MADERSFSEKAEQLRSDMERRSRERQQDSDLAIRRSLKDWLVGLAALGALVLVALAAIMVFSLVVWLAISAAAAIVTFVGAVLVVVIASAVWQEIKPD